MVSTLARASIDGAILVGVIWVFSRLLQLTPATRTVLWWCAAAKFVVALAWTTPIPIPILPAQPRPAATVVVGAAPGGGGSRDDDASRRARRAVPVQRSLRSSFAEVFHEWSPFAAIGWTFGLMGVALIGVRRSRETARMCAESEPAPDAVQRLAIDLALHLRLRRAPEIRVSRLVETPLVMGLVRPVVLLPSDRFAELTDRQQQMALCHELAHLKRADLWLGCVPALAERIFFFHPLVHLASREYALAREAACDATVMDTLDAAPQEYGRLLLALGVSRPQSGLTAAGAAWSFLNLKRRIAMLQDVSARSNCSRVMAAGVVGLALAAMVPMQLAARRSTMVVAEPAPIATPQAEEWQPAPRPERERQKPEAAPTATSHEDENFSFVLLSEGHPRIMSGQIANVARARQLANGAPLLWVRVKGHEYVVREPDLLRKIRSLWTPINEPELADLDALQTLTESLDIDTVVADSKLALEHGRLGAELGSLATQEALHALTDARDAMSALDRDDFERHRRAMDESTRELKEDMGQLKHRLKTDLDFDMRDLHHQFRALEPAIRELTAPMEEFGHRMEAFAQMVETVSRSATEEMRALIDRAIASGLAQPVR